MPTGLPQYGTRKNPLTGKIETYELPAQANMEQSRKNFRDFIQGNFQWHDDPYAKANQASKELVFESDQDEDWIDIYHISLS